MAKSVMYLYLKEQTDDSTVPIHRKDRAKRRLHDLADTGSKRRWNCHILKLDGKEWGQQLTWVVS